MLWLLLRDGGSAAAVVSSNGGVRPGQGSPRGGEQLPEEEKGQRIFHMLCRPFTALISRRLVICSPWRVTTLPPPFFFKTSSEPCCTP